MKEKFVYIVIRKTFIDTHCIDTACAIDYTDVHSFSSNKKAEEYIQNQIKWLGNNIPFEEVIVPESELFNDTTRSYKYYAQQTYNERGLRYGFMLIKQTIE